MTVEETRKTAEAEIKRVIEDGVEAIRDKNLEGVMSLYAPEVVSFAIVPPLQYVGAEAFRKQWEEVFSSFQDPIGYEIADLSITETIQIRVLVLCPTRSAYCIIVYERTKRYIEHPNLNGLASRC